MKLELPSLGADSQKQYRLGIMGGTFDPIHNGHLLIAEQAKEGFSLDAVLFMPARHTNLKEGSRGAGPEHRFAMSLLATAGNEHFFTSRIEIDREGVSYTATTLLQLRAYYPSNVELYFISGADAISKIGSWHKADSIAELATIVACSRYGYNLERTQEAILKTQIPFRIFYKEIPALGISSSDLRARLRAKKSCRYLVPQAVLDYIEKNNLYQELT